jgi:hypothetical protein
VPPDESRCIGFGDRIAECLDTAAMQERIDPAMTTQLIPSCNTSMGFAFPPRRFVQLAQAWGKDAYVDSICKDDWRTAFGVIAGRLVESLNDDYVCVDAPPPFDGSSCTAGCWLIETLDDARACASDPSCPQEWCPAGATAEYVNRLEPCRDPSTGAECVPLKRDLGTAIIGGYERRHCLVRQVPRDPLAFRCGEPLGDGWYYMPPEWAEHACAEVSFFRAAVDPLLDRGSSAALRCPR